MKFERTYGTLDSRFGKDEVLTMNQMISRYRIQKWDKKGSDSRMSISDIKDDIRKNGVFCLS